MTHLTAATFTAPRYQHNEMVHMQPRQSRERGNRLTQTAFVTESNESAIKSRWRRFFASLRIPQYFWQEDPTVIGFLQLACLLSCEKRTDIIIVLSDACTDEPSNWKISAWNTTKRHFGKNEIVVDRRGTSPTRPFPIGRVINHPVLMLHPFGPPVSTCCRIQVVRSRYTLTVFRRHNYYSFMSRSTCISLYPATNWQQCCRRHNKHVDGNVWIQLVSGNMCPGVNAS